MVEEQGRRRRKGNVVVEEEEEERKQVYQLGEGDLEEGRDSCKSV